MTKRPEVLAVVIGRNRRVYARIYKMTNRIEAFSKHYYATETEKSREEGFRPVGMDVENHDGIVIYRVKYESV